MKSLLSTLAIAVLLAAPLANAQRDMDTQQHMEQMQQRMEQMHQQMERIQQTQDEKERQRLMQEHWRTMREQMTDMRGMGGNMMGRMHGRRGGNGDMPMHGMDPEQREAMMQNRMDMMHMMMEHMMEHHEMMGGPGSRRR
ncbi:MAG TPA: hypothetical protein VMP00_16640 [Burkholderiales bacterium]|nr:hypothetical protein [Burkholderiales bacterium]